jgi:hypothetical protein
MIADGTDGQIKSSGYTINKSVPSNAVFTDTDTKVSQTATTTSANYEILFSATADNTTRTESARKTSGLRYNPNNDTLYIGRSGSTTGKIYFYSTYNNKSMYSRIEQTFNPA